MEACEIISTDTQKSCQVQGQYWRGEHYVLTPVHLFGAILLVSSVSSSF